MTSISRNKILSSLQHILAGISEIGTTTVLGHIVFVCFPSGIFHFVVRRPMLYIYIYIHIYIYIYIKKMNYTYYFAYSYVYIYWFFWNISLSVYIRIYIYSYIHRCIYISLPINIYIYIYIYMIRSEPPLLEKDIFGHLLLAC